MKHSHEAHTLVKVAGGFFEIHQTLHVMDKKRLVSLVTDWSCYKRGFCTGLGVHGEVRLALQDAVHHTSAVAIRRVVGICGGQLDHRCSCINMEGKKVRRSGWNAKKCWGARKISYSGIITEIKWISFELKLLRLRLAAGINYAYLLQSHHESRFMNTEWSRWRRACKNKPEPRLCWAFTHVVLVLCCFL